MRIFTAVFSLAIYGSISALPEPQMQNVDGEVSVGGCKFHSQMRNMSLPAGSTVKLMCPLDLGGTCMVDRITWFKSETRNGPRKPKISQFFGEPLLYYVQAAIEEETGWYFCVASSQSGGQTMEAATYLKVTPRHRNLKPLPSPARQVAGPPPRRPPHPTTTVAPPPSLGGVAPGGRINQKLPIYNKWMDGRGRQAPPRHSADAGLEERVENILARHLGAIYHQLEDLSTAVTDINKRLAVLEDKTRRM